MSNPNTVVVSAEEFFKGHTKHPPLKQKTIQEVGGYSRYFTRPDQVETIDFSKSSNELKNVYNKKDSNARNILGYLFNENPYVASVFFAEENINYVHDSLRYQIYNNSNGEDILAKQNINNLMNIMREVYVEYYSVPGPGSNIQLEVQKLNDMVISLLIPEMTKAIEQQKNFYKFKDTNPFAQYKNPLLAADIDVVMSGDGVKEPAEAKRIITESGKTIVVNPSTTTIRKKSGTVYWNV